MVKSPKSCIYRMSVHVSCAHLTAHRTYRTFTASHTRTTASHTRTLHNRTGFHISNQIPIAFVLKIDKHRRTAHFYTQPIFAQKGFASSSWSPTFRVPALKFLFTWEPFFCLWLGTFPPDYPLFWQVFFSLHVSGTAHMSATRMISFRLIIINVQ